ncbi:MAG: hypothetical protein V7703_21380, partial [Hyphomicrobiales bacterium]
MLEPVFQFGDTIIIGRDLLIAGLVALVLFAWLMLRSQGKTRAQQARVVEDAQRRAQELEARLLDMSRTQSEITGQVRTMSDVL